MNKISSTFFKGWFVVTILLLSFTLAFASFSYRVGAWEIQAPDGSKLVLGTNDDDDIELVVDQTDESVGWIVDESADGLLAAKGGTSGLRVGADKLRQIRTVTNVDTQNSTLDVAELATGITVHTSVTGAGTVTFDTAALIIAGSSTAGVLDTDNECIEHIYINDGTETLTFAIATGVTIADTGQTLAANESAIILICRTAATTVTAYIIGA